MKRSAQLASRGIPSARTGKLKVKGTRGRGNHVWPVSLGNTPIIVRSLVSVGGQRRTCKWTKKLENKARRAGFANSEQMLRATAKLVRS